MLRPSSTTASAATSSSFLEKQQKEHSEQEEDDNLEPLRGMRLEYLKCYPGFAEELEARHARAAEGVAGMTPT